MPRGKKAQAVGENPAVEEALAEEPVEQAPEVAEQPAAVGQAPRPSPEKVKICNPTYAGRTVTSQNVVAQFDENGIAELTDEESALFLRVPGYSLVE